MADGTEQDRIYGYSQDGTFGSILPTDLEEARANGFAPATEAQIAKEVIAPEEAGFGGLTRALTGTFGNIASFGLTGEFRDPEEEFRLQAAQEQHPIATYLGGGAGLAAGALGGAALGVGRAGLAAGGLAEAAAGAAIPTAIGKSIAKPILGKAAQYGTEFGLMSTPKAIAQFSKGDKEEALETILSGVGGGAALGGGLGVVGRMLSPAAKLSRYVPERLKDFSVTQQMKGLGYQKSFAKKYPMERLEENLKYVKEKGLDSIWETASDKQAALESILQQNGQKLGEIYKMVDSAGVDFVNPNPLLKRFEKIAGQISDDDVVSTLKSSANKGVSSLKKRIFVEGDKELGELPVTLTSLAELRQSLRQVAFDSNTPKTIKNIYSQMWGAVDEELGAALKRAERKAPGLFKGAKEDWTAAKYEYRNAIMLDDLLANRVAQQGNQTLSLSTMFSAGASAAAAGEGNRGLAAILGTAFNALRKEYGGAVAGRAVERGLDISKAVGSRVKSISENTLNRVSMPAKVGAATILRDLTDEDDDYKALDKVSGHLSQLINNPQYATERLSQVGEGFSDDPADNFAAQQKVMEAAKLLLEQLPKKQSAASPFQADIAPYSDQDIYNFQKKMAAAIDPVGALSGMQSGVMDMETIDILKKLYPRLYQRMVEQVLNGATDKQRTYTMSQKINLSTMLGYPVDSILQPKNIQVFQNNFDRKPVEQKQSSSSGRSKNNLEGQLTQSQRIENR